MPRKLHCILRSALLAALFTVAGCETLDGFMAGLKNKPGPDYVAIEERPVVDPIDINRFELTSETQTVVGTPQIVLTGPDDTFSDLARAYGLGYDELVAANPGIDPWLPGNGTPILLPTQYVLPDAPKRGVILNIATKRLFYFPPVADGDVQTVLTYPIGIGRVGWETPLGETTVIAKAKNPSWWVPASVRREHAELGDPLPSVVPPGPDNPLGTRVLKLDMPGYLIHGTNQPYGVGMRVSHGCVRLYPENIEFLYTLVGIGESVTIINEPYQAGQANGQLFFEAHAPLEDDDVLPAERLGKLLASLQGADGQGLNVHLLDHIRAVAANPVGVPVSVVDYDTDEYMARAQVVHNIVVADPNEPTLAEIREMMDEVAAEVGAEKTAPQ